MSKPKCDHDCLNCIYDDCISDDLARLNEDADRFNGNKSSIVNRTYKTSEAHRASSRAYHEKNREKHLAYEREYNQTHADEIRESKRAYRAAHREQYRDANKKYYYEHRAEILEKKREYRKRKKALLAEGT